MMVENAEWILSFIQCELEALGSVLISTDNGKLCKKNTGETYYKSDMMMNYAFWFWFVIQWLESHIPQEVCNGGSQFKQRKILNSWMFSLVQRLNFSSFSQHIYIESIISPEAQREVK